MPFREAETLAVRAKDVVMQVYVAALDNRRARKLTAEILRNHILAAYRMDDTSQVFLGIGIEVILPFLVFRRLGFTQEVLLAALAELEAEGAIPNEEAIRAGNERDIAQAKEILSGHKKPTR